LVAPITFGGADFECADEEAAIKKVQLTMDGRDTEVWEQGRFIVRLFSHLIRK